jgi:flavodoxin
MNALIVYDSKFGNTERIARAIAGRLGSARLIRAEEAGALGRLECDLLIVAGPTQRHGASPAMQEWLERIPRGTLKDVPAATFDTRYRVSRFLSGSAAARIEGRLKRAGARLVVPPESFFMERDVPPQGEKRRHEMEQLEPGEEERAAEWAAIILERMGAAREPGREGARGLLD